MVIGSLCDFWVAGQFEIGGRPAPAIRTVRIERLERDRSRPNRAASGRQNKQAVLMKPPF